MTINRNISIIGGIYVKKLLLVSLSLFYLAACTAPVGVDTGIIGTIIILREGHLQGDLETIVGLFADPFTNTTGEQITRLDLWTHLAAFYEQYVYLVYEVDLVEVQNIAPDLVLATISTHSVAQGPQLFLTTWKTERLTLKYVGQWQIIAQEILTLEESVEPEEQQPPFTLDVQIVGPQTFQEKVRESLRLLYETSYEHFALVNQTLNKIQAGEHSGAEVWTRTFVIGPASQNTDPYWLASIILHDTVHVVQYLEQRTFFGKEAELEALEVQLAGLIAMKAPEHHITYIQQILADPDGNNYWDGDYNDRNW